MLIAEDELGRMHKRFPYPRFSSAEYERRYSNIRAMMMSTINTKIILFRKTSAAAPVSLPRAALAGGGGRGGCGVAVESRGSGAGGVGGGRGGDACREVDDAADEVVAEAGIADRDRRQHTPGSQ